MRVGVGGGARTTLHVASYERNAFSARVVVLERPARLVRWCGDQGVPHAVIGGFFDHAFAQSVGANRRAAVTSATEEVERALEGNRRRASILEQFHALGSDETPAV